MINTLRCLNGKLFEDVISFMKGFYALYNHEGKLITLHGNAPPLLSNEISKLLEKAHIVNLDVNYDYHIPKFENFSCYIYRTKNEDGFLHAVIGVPHAEDVSAITSALPIGILKINQRWEVYYVNEHAQFLFGLNAEELYGNRWVSIINQKIISEIYEYFKSDYSLFDSFKKIFEHTTPLGKKRVLSLVVSKNLDYQKNRDFYFMMVQDITREYRTNQEVIFNATHDDLTKLFNRKALLEKIRSIVKQDELESIALLFLDLDGFKFINDTYGHSIGDEVLKIVARKLQSVTKERDIVARIGGDEFIVFLNGVKDKSNIFGIANKIALATNVEVKIDEHNIKISSSIGLSLGDSLHEMDIVNLSDDELIDKWFSTADIAMYESKKNKMGKVIVFDKLFHQAYLNEIAREKFIKDVVLQDAAEIYFQPIYFKDKIYSLEALARFKEQILTLG